MRPFARVSSWLTSLGTSSLVPALAISIAFAASPSSTAGPTTATAPAHPAKEFTVGDADIHVDVDGSRFSAGPDLILAWIRRSAAIVSAYYGRFPTRTLRVEVEPQSGNDVNGGTTWGYGGGLIRVRVGRDVTEAVLLDDWVLVHEMIHLALPDVGEEHAWLSEGLATYVEGVARVQAGNRSEEDVWAEELRMMPRGLPEAGDRGLDRTHTWGRTYWGGAMYCLLADVEIRERTGVRKGLQDALRAIAAESGGLVTDWPIERVLRTGDRALGTSALGDLYSQMKNDPMRPDLTGLWTRLGVERDGSNVRLRDDAPLSDVRRAIMRAPAARATSD